MPETIIVTIPHLKNVEYRLPWSSYHIYSAGHIKSLSKKFYPHDIERPKSICIRDLEGKLCILPESQILNTLVNPLNTAKYLKLIIIPVARGIERPVVEAYRPPTAEEQDHPSFLEKLLQEPLGTTKEFFIKRSCPVIWDDATAECSICLNGDSCDDFRRIPECGHVFHSECIITWLCTGRNKSCPLCRASAKIE